MLSPWWTRRIAYDMSVAEMRLSCGAQSPRLLSAGIGGFPAHLCKHIADLENLQLGAPRLVLGLVDGVGHNDLVQGTRVDAVDGVATKDAMRDQRIHLRGALLLDQLGRACDSVGCVRQVVDENGGAICDVANQHHGRVLAVADLCGAALLVDEGEGHAERVGDGCSALCASRIRTDDDGLLVVGYVRLDVLAQEVTAVQVIDGDVEEALILRVCDQLART
jgi:hypothetical protein